MFENIDWSRVGPIIVIAGIVVAAMTGIVMSVYYPPRKRNVRAGSASTPPHPIPEPTRTPPRPPLPMNPMFNCLGDLWDSDYKVILRDELHHAYACRIGEFRAGLIQIALSERTFVWTSPNQIVTLAKQKKKAPPCSNP